MNPRQLKSISEMIWELPQTKEMRVPAFIYADRGLIEDMDDKVLEQTRNVCNLPGIVRACYVMPDAHWGYGFPIGGVAAFDPEEGGVVSAGGVGFDISCGVRMLKTNLTREDIEPLKKKLADALYSHVPVGVGSRGKIHLNDKVMSAMLLEGAKWAIKQGYGYQEDLERIEERGAIPDANPDAVSARAKVRQQEEMGTLGSGNHYLEIQYVSRVFNRKIAKVYGLQEKDVMISIHCGSRGLGHQIGTDFLREMLIAAPQYGIRLPDKELACAPILSPLGERYLGAMRAAMNCALANRQIITHLVREVFEAVLPSATLNLFYDVSHNTCKVEQHLVTGKPRNLYVHRKGATRAFWPGHPEIPASLRAAGQPVLIGGTMGTESYILAGAPQSEQLSFGSACHGAGRAMSRREATRRWKGGEVIAALAKRGIYVQSTSLRGIAEEAPDAYKNVTTVVNAAEQAGLSVKVACLKPLVCIKG